MQKSRKVNKNNMVIGWAIYRWAMYSCSQRLAAQMMFKDSEGNISLQLQRFLQLVPGICSRELEGKVAKGGVGFGDDQ